jgi:hypothetical protein
VAGWSFCRQVSPEYCQCRSIPCVVDGFTLQATCNAAHPGCLRQVPKMLKCAQGCRGVFHARTWYLLVAVAAEQPG